jgi:hypothetical protein
VPVLTKLARAFDEAAGAIVLTGPELPLCAQIETSERLEIAAHHHLAIGLHGERINLAIRARIEGRIRATSSIQPRDILPGLPTNCPEVTASDHFAVG